MTRRPTLLLVDDHALMTEGLCNMLEPEYEIVGVVREGPKVKDAVLAYSPDLVLLDLSLPGMSGLQVLAQLREFGLFTPVLFVTMHSERLYAEEALRNGAIGYVLKLARAEELRHAISEALAGREYVTPLLTGLPAMGATTQATQAVPPDAGIKALTGRQREVLRLIARGWTTEEIAVELDLSAKSVEYHRVRIRKTLGFTSTAALVRYAVSEGLV